MEQYSGVTVSIHTKVSFISKISLLSLILTFTMQHMSVFLSFRCPMTNKTSRLLKKIKESQCLSYILILPVLPNYKQQQKVDLYLL